MKEVEKAVNSYDGKMIKTGDVIELFGDLANKATSNPDYQEVESSIEATEKRLSIEQSNAVVARIKTNKKKIKGSPNK